MSYLCRLLVYSCACICISAFLPSSAKAMGESDFLLGGKSVVPAQWFDLAGKDAEVTPAPEPTPAVETVAARAQIPVPPPTPVFQQPAYQQPVYQPAYRQPVFPQSVPVRTYSYPVSSWPYTPVRQMPVQVPMRAPSYPAQPSYRYSQPVYSSPQTRCQG